MKILIVDDSKAMRFLVRRTLRQTGLGEHETFEASSGKQALEVVAAQNPDLILSDWNMPEMSGLELLEQLRADKSQVTFGFITTEGTPLMRQQALASGAAFLVVKPFSAESMRAALKGFFNEP